MNRRARRHSQKAAPWTKVCPLCKAGACHECVDVFRAVYADDRICTCKKANHKTDVGLAITTRSAMRLSEGNEAHTQQIEDPTTGIIHAPGLTVSPDGEVKFRDEE